VDDPPGARTLSDRPLPIPPGLRATLVLLRHGESTALTEGRFQGRLDTPLSQLGVRQAELAGARLAAAGVAPRIPVPGRPPTEIVHSPLGRARQTAEAAGAALRAIHGAGVPDPRPDGGLLELGQGEWEGLLRTEVMERYPVELADWRLRPAETQAPGGERVIDAAVRARLALATTLDRLAAVPAGEDARRWHATGYPAAHGSDAPWTLLVGHDGIFKVALLTLLGLPLERFWIFPWGLTGITVVELVEGRAVLRAHNLTDHLGPLQADGPTVPLADDEARSEADADARERSGSL
jgi:broad specificity phosphatase PhoE